MALYLKRSCSSLPFSSTPRPLKKCRRVNEATCFTVESRNKDFVSSSDEEEDDSDSEPVYDHRIERRKSLLRRRSSTRSAAETPANLELSRAVALYSDDEEDEEERMKKEEQEGIEQAEEEAEQEVKETEQDRKDEILSDNKRSVNSSDLAARSRCLEYLVSAIDEAWARYCDATSYEEGDQVAAHTPSSISITDNDDYSDSAPSLAETEITDYADDFELDPKLKRQVCDVRKNQHQTSSLQHLKDRLTNTKYYLQDFVESDDYQDCVAFWKRWDMIKYCTIELVEDEDEEDVVESTIEELENGRCQLAC